MLSMNKITFFERYLIINQQFLESCAKNKGKWVNSKFNFRFAKVTSVRIIFARLTSESAP